MPPPTPNQRVLVLWVIWFAMFSGVFIYQFTLGKGIPRGENAPSSEPSPILYVVIAQLVAATVVRWLIIPRVREIPKQLVLMIIGLALSEAVEIFGLFLVPADQPQTKLLLWILSIVSVLQFAPVYARDPLPAAGPPGSTTSVVDRKERF